MSTVFYKWGAGRDESRITFDGTHISVFDLKREIILTNKMGNGRDFDLSLYDNVTGEELKDDNHQIPRSSSLIAKRLPCQTKGRGNAQNYIIGTAAGEALTGDHRIEAHAREAMLAKQNKGLRGANGGYGSLTKRFDGKDDKPAEAPVPISTGNAEEDEQVKAFFEQGRENWQENLDDMSSNPRAAAQYRQRRPNAAPTGNRFDYSMAPDREVPPGYICYRCGQKGHWIQDCPNGDNPDVADRKRFVRVTGIPRSMLQTVDTPVGNEGSSTGAMLTADGGFVRAVPDQRAWQKQAAKPRLLTNAQVRDHQPVDATLTCQLCKKLLWEAVKTPCCDTAFCEECIQTYLLDHSFECPTCESKIASLEGLKVDEDLRARVASYVDGEIERSKREGSGTGENEDGVKSENGSAQPENTNSQEEGRSGSNRASSTAGESNTGVALDPARMQEMLNPQTMSVYMTQVQKMLRNPNLTQPARVLLQAQLQAVNASVMQMQIMAATGGMMGGDGQMNMPMGMGIGMGYNQHMGMGYNEFNGMGGMGNNMGMNQGMGGGMNMGNGNGMGMMGAGMGMGNGFGNGNGNAMNQGMGMGFGNGGYQNGNGGGGGGMGMGMGNNGRGRGGFGFGGRGFRGRGRGMGPGMGMGMGMGMGQGPARPPMGMKRPAEDGFEVPVGDKVSRVN